MSEWLKRVAIRDTTVEFMHTFKTNCNETRLQRFCMQLRRLVDRIDGRFSIAVEMYSLPVLTTTERADVMYQGVKHMGSIHREMVREKADDACLKKACPQLYGDAP